LHFLLVYCLYCHNFVVLNKINFRSCKISNNVYIFDTQKKVYLVKWYMNMFKLCRWNVDIIRIILHVPLDKFIFITYVFILFMWQWRKSSFQSDIIYYFNDCTHFTYPIFLKIKSILKSYLVIYILLKNLNISYLRKLCWNQYPITLPDTLYLCVIIQQQ